jgi:hypothetical protein
MIRHHAIAQDAGVMTGDGVTEQPYERSVVSVRLEERQASSRSIQDVKNETRGVKAWSSRHSELVIGDGNDDAVQN